MDRNETLVILAKQLNVALRKESVDRNGLGGCHYRDDVSSLSARRAWIEMKASLTLTFGLWSLSARRAWIEITMRRDFKALGLRRSPQGERG